jgi:hypothetical protein
MSSPVRASLVQTIVDGIQKKPGTKAEALALVKYVFASEIAPLCDDLLKALIALAPVALQPELQGAVTLAEDFLESPEVVAAVTACVDCKGCSA